MTTQAKDQVLLLVHRIPFPPDKGDKIRSWHLLDHLARHCQVHAGYFIDDANDLHHVGKVDAVCASTCCIVLQPLQARLKSLVGLLSGGPLTLDYYQHKAMRSWVDDTIARHNIRHIVVFSSAMAQYVEQHQDARRIIDFVDIDSDKWRQYAEKKWWPLSWLYYREATRLLQYERKIAALFDYSLFVSRQESDLFRRLAPESAGKIGYFSNGVDTGYFSPDLILASPYPAARHNIVFTGAMDYWPNCDAVTWFAQDILPLIRNRYPSAHFYIVGARPGKAVRELALLDGVFVTGTVPDVRPYLAHAQAAVAPLRIARGIQNKVLEAMAMARTVVVTPDALEGIDAVSDAEILLAHNEHQFATHICNIFSGAQPDLGMAARKKMMSAYGWDANLGAIDRVLMLPDAVLEAHQ
jgi:sugar transferase (PEP-CTERM/EpsH1 system associated)